ncbi:DUF3810 domain-containing protein [Anaerocolumna xylanovorans]|uniref:DUF3810 domain-containing protein n=1 Tax=Anaerocolumna xylanovorans DSM 12503 TaxID=1121345 RepID=A0A1M7YMK8_9FIRM|nr:DUF3810 domain-containing protein [Anaerocolumna xylanovorans]SHO53903.1 Protein of unknown function [Anaerocolumna xylanovorans DSM 12503]
MLKRSTQPTINIKWYKAFLRRRVFLLLLAPVAFFFLRLAKINPDFAELIYARKIYKGVSHALSFLSDKLPFSLMEIEIKLLPFLVILGLVYFIYQIVSRKKKGRTAGYIITLSLINIVCIASVLFFFYVSMAGINYHRYSFAKISGYDIEKSSAEDLYNMTLDLSERAAKVRTLIEQGGGEFTKDGSVSIDKSNWEDLVNAEVVAYAKTGEEYPELKGDYKSVKAVASSKVMSAMEITGIFWPFTMEANVNTDVVDYSIPATMCHEMAHLRGFMREDEANFIAYLVCSNSDNLVLQYSGLMLALTYAGNQLYNQSPEYYEKVRATYTTEMAADLRADYYYWVQFEDTVISTASNTVNDSYLKANSQSDGVKSYGRMVDLLLAEYKANHQN